MAKLAIKNKTKLLVKHARLYFVRRPRLKRRVLSLLAYYPGLLNSLAIATLAPPLPSSELPHQAFDVENLTQHAQRIHTELKAALAQRMQEGI